MKTFQVIKFQFPVAEGLNFSQPQLLADGQPLESANHLITRPPGFLPYNDRLNKTHLPYGLHETIKIDKIVRSLL